MKKNHLTYFKVENFKKFDSLEVNDIGQFNLIVGDNNVGKTCLLEALLFDENPQQLLDNFYLALTKRGLKFQVEEITRKANGISTTEILAPKENYFEKYIIKKEDRIIINYKFLLGINKNIKIRIPSEIEIKENILKTEIINNKEYLKQYVVFSQWNPTKVDNKFLWIYDYDLNILNFPLISFNDTPLEEESRSIYENLKTKREKQILIDVLKVVNQNIVDIELRENFEDLKSVFLISFYDKDEFVALNFLGDGFKRIFYIVLKALSLKGKRILIDEIEIGIHHTKMKDFWVNIMKVCKELDVQLFATTHSSECIEDYVKAAKEVGDEDIRLIRLQENKDKSIKAICYPFNEFEDIAESKTENR